MNLLRKPSTADVVAIATDASALALPPGAYGIVPDWWNDMHAGAIPELEFELWSAVAVSVTAAILYGATIHPFAIADKTFVAELGVKSELDLATKTTNCSTVIRAKIAGEAGDAFQIAFVQSGAVANGGTLVKVGSVYTFTFKNGVTTVANFETLITASADLEVKAAGAAHVLVSVVDEFGAANLAGGDDTSLVAAGHGLETGDGPTTVSSTIALPAGLLAATDYWVIKDGTGEFNLAATLADALAGTAIAITDVGSGVLTLSDTADTQRLTWQTHDGLLGVDSDGAIALDAQIGYRKVIPHSPRVFAYALVATLDTGTVSAAIVPRQDSE
jgi:hypothetical protein